MIIAIANGIVHVLCAHLAEHALEDVNRLVETIFRVWAVPPLYVLALVGRKIRRNSSRNKYYTVPVPMAQVLRSFLARLVCE